MYLYICLCFLCIVICMHGFHSARIFKVCNSVIWPTHSKFDYGHIVLNYTDILCTVHWTRMLIYIGYWTLNIYYYYYRFCIIKMPWLLLFSINITWNFDIFFSCVCLFVRGEFLLDFRETKRHWVMHLADEMSPLVELGFGLVVTGMKMIDELHPSRNRQLWFLRHRGLVAPLLCHPLEFGHEWVVVVGSRGAYYSLCPQREQLLLPSHI